MEIDPIEWLAEANRRHANQEYTPWFVGTTWPSRIGWYERCFTDGTLRQWWNGRAWLTSNLSLAREHWRQVGDYPAWRGLMTPNAQYQIAPASSLRGLLDDFTCLFGAGLGAVEALADELTPVQWAGVYALRQASAVFEEIERRVSNLGAPESLPAIEEQS
jgi:hypothetical protein